MSESEVFAWVAFSWCYFWGAIVSFVLAYISRTPGAPVSRQTVLVALGWAVTMPCIIINVFAEMGKEGK